MMDELKTALGFLLLIVLPLFLAGWTSSDEPQGWEG